MSNGLVRLYGMGAAVFSTDKDEYRVRNGVLEVPIGLVAAARERGFTSTPPDPDPVPEMPEPSAAPSVSLGSQSPIDPEAIQALLKAEADQRAVELRALPIEERKVAYRAEVVAAGYKEDAVDQIVAQRLQFDECLAEGMSEDEAREFAYGSPAGDAALKAVADENAVKPTSAPKPSSRSRR